MKSSYLRKILARVSARPSENSPPRLLGEVLGWNWMWSSWTLCWRARRGLFYSFPTLEWMMRTAWWYPTIPGGYMHSSGSHTRQTPLPLRTQLSSRTNLSVYFSPLPSRGSPPSPIQTSSSGAPMHPRIQSVRDGALIAIQFGDAIALCARGSLLSWDCWTN